ncbi:hypothetical protein J6590_059076 [Homalodisca vitripennis]|nr:hypothetical protein J6590_059076 [Homalodisca vitripennis]
MHPPVITAEVFVMTTSASGVTASHRFRPRLRTALRLISESPQPPSPSDLRRATTLADCGDESENGTLPQLNLTAFLLLLFVFRLSFSVMKPFMMSSWLTCFRMSCFTLCKAKTFSVSSDKEIRSLFLVSFSLDNDLSAE